MTLEFRDIHHLYPGRLPANGKQGRANGVENINLSLKKGEILSLYGPSGCGKTTLLRLATGLEKADSGEILLDGDPLDNAENFIPVEKRPIGYVFQDHILFPHLTVADNIVYGLRGQSKPSQKAVMAQWITRLRLEGLEGRYPHQLSGGQQQRVAIARALARKPKAVVMDEPFASIGADLRQTLQKEIREILKQDEMATIFVTHDSHEALMMGDRLALMQNGKFVEISTPQDLFERPKTREGAMFFSDRQYGVATRDNNGWYCPFGEISIPDGLDLAPSWTSIQFFIDREAITVTVLENAQATSSRDVRHPRILECRFKGPGWSYLIGAGDGHIITVFGSEPIEIGTPVQCNFDARKIRYIEEWKAKS